MKNALFADSQFEQLSAEVRLAPAATVRLVWSLSRSIGQPVEDARRPW